MVSELKTTFGLFARRVRSLIGLYDNTDSTFAACFPSETGRLGRPGTPSILMAKALT
jgi:hypothetical protein